MSETQVATTETGFQYDQWRSRFLTWVLRFVSVLGLLLILPNVLSASRTDLIVYGATYLVFVVITFAPFSFTIKGIALLAASYLAGTFTSLNYGPWSDAVAYLLLGTMFAALLFDRRAGFIMMLLNLMSLTAIALLNLLGYLPLLAADTIPTSTALDWGINIADFVLLSMAGTWAVNLLKQEFQTVATKFTSTLALLTKDREELEMRVMERTAGLTIKTEQLRAASYIARQTAEIQSLESLLNIVVRLITDQFGVYHTGIFLLNETGNEAVLLAASSEGGQRMIEKGHSLRVGAQGIVGYVAAQKKPRVALDVGTDAAFFNNPDLPATRSEVAIPLIIRNKVLGVLDIQSNKPQAFSADDTDVFETLADQLAVAIENARLLDESKTALMQLEAVTASSTRDAWSRKIEERGAVYTYTPLGLRAEKVSGVNESVTVIPIQMRGQKIGSISVARKGKGQWSKVDEEFIAEIATQAGLAIENIRLLEDATRRAQQEQTVGQLAARFSQSLDIDSLLQTAARELGQLPEVSEVSVLLNQAKEKENQPGSSRLKNKAG